MRKLNGISKNNGSTNVKHNQHQNIRDGNFQHKGKYGENLNNGKGIQCHECGDFGHIQAKCLNFLRKQKGL